MRSALLGLLVVCTVAAHAAIDSHANGAVDSQPTRLSAEVTNLDQIAPITLWTAWGFPVIDFNTVVIGPARNTP